MLFPKLKNDDIISTNSSFYCFFIRTLLRGGGGLQKKSVLYAHDNDGKNG